MADTDERFCLKRRKSGVNEGVCGEHLKAAIEKLGRMSMEGLRLEFKMASKFRAKYGAVLLNMGLEPEGDCLYRQHCVFMQHVEREGRARKGGLGEFAGVV